MKPQELDWLSRNAEQWRQQEESGRRPHAVLLAGPPGVGKRAYANWLAARALGRKDAPPLPVYPYELEPQPDFYWLEVNREENKKQISVDQVRALIYDLGLTRHGEAGKVAVIDSVNQLSIGAANGLLKTLEEPPGDVLLVLIADRMSRLPATILSRCQRVMLKLPEQAAAMAWLDRVRPGRPWAEALAEAGGAPLAALALAESLEERAAMARDLQALAARRTSPVLVAERWSKGDPYAALDWLGRAVAECIRLRATGRNGIVENSVLQRMDSRNLFCYLDIINHLRAQTEGSWNPQLTLEGLLIDWADGLRRVREPARLQAMWPQAAAR